MLTTLAIIFMTLEHLEDNYDFDFWDIKTLTATLVVDTIYIILIRLI